MKLISREEAIAQGLPRYFTGEPCQRGHVADRKTRDGRCHACVLEAQRERRRAKVAADFPEGRKPWKACAEGEKVCTACRMAKSKSDFYADSRASDGLQPQCSRCQQDRAKAKKEADPVAAKKKRREYYSENKSAFARRAKKFRETHQDYLKASKKAYYEMIKQDPEWQSRQKALRDLNKDSKRKYDKEYRAKADPKALLERANRWRKENPEKRSAIIKAYSARRRSNCRDGDPTAAIAAWESSARKVCYWCSKPCGDNYHVDHYQPLARGGKHVISNLVIACPNCNHRKNAKDPYEFAASMGRLF
ncbi:hypothetical protein HBO32_30830 [Pseudomonas nitroreducens]|uniref:HNH endonuclease n=1 Tax=Pseudomonas nitroreducens TaxID=46680 RepID=UPI0014756BF6|nr:HNH endonuclease [Pseudomonas nitroreducens]NMZ77494.1 hypothetical protein [Pseudomonas nitroreducens]